MTEEDNIPTLGKSTSSGGFGKRPLPVQMQVDATEVQTMQRGYEMRIARQRDAITRLQNLAAEQADKFTEWMRDEIERTGRIDESDQAPVLAVAGGVISDDELETLLTLLPDDFFGRYSSAREAIEIYIKHLQNDVQISKQKQSYLAKMYQKPMDQLMEWLGQRVMSSVIASDTPAKAIKDYINSLETQLQQAQANAQVAKSTANQALKVVDADDTPPWLKDEPKSFVQPATIGASGVWTNEPDRQDSKTLDDWAPPGNQLPPGETRPGLF